MTKTGADGIERKALAKEKKRKHKNYARIYKYRYMTKTLQHIT